VSSFPDPSFPGTGQLLAACAKALYISRASTA
jgi:hypothetical protein